MTVKHPSMSVIWQDTRIGSLAHYPTLDGWIFISILPGNPGQHRTASSLEAAIKRVEKRFPGATIKEG